MKIAVLLIVLFFISATAVIACYNPNDEFPISPYPTIEPSQEPTITEPEVNIEPTITEIPTATPSATPASDGRSDGKSDGRSDGLCSLPPCMPYGGPPNTGRAK